VNHYSYTRRSIVTDVLWSVCLLIATTSLAKADEPIEVPFWLTRVGVGPRKCALGGARIPRRRKGRFGEDISASIVKQGVKIQRAIGIDCV